MKVAEQSDQHWVAPPSAVGALGMAIKQHLTARRRRKGKAQRLEPRQHPYSITRKARLPTCTQS